MKAKKLKKGKFRKKSERPLTESAVSELKDMLNDLAGEQDTVIQNEMKENEIQYIATKELIPYENNPRINDGAVYGVAQSIKEFGFLNPIIIDKNNVIAAGHTRLKAAELLENTTLKVLEISLKVGFRSQTKFGICFKKYYGVNPLEYRRKTKLTSNHE